MLPRTDCGFLFTSFEPIVRHIMGPLLATANPNNKSRQVSGLAAWLGHTHYGFFSTSAAAGLAEGGNSPSARRITETLPSAQVILAPPEFR
jgi:hypothetical protein